MTKLRSALLGVTATLLGLGAAHLVAALLDPATSPAYAVGSVVIDLTPTPIKEWAVATFGTADKPILLSVVLLVTLTVAALAGIWGTIRFARGATLLGVLAILAGAAALTRPAAGVLDILPALTAGVVGIGALRLFLVGGRARPSTTADESDSSAGSAGSVSQTAPTPSRRGLLVGAGLIAAAALAGTGEWISRTKTRIADIALPKPKSPAGAFPEGLETRVRGITPLRTSVDDFYRVDTRLVVPTVDVGSWTLTIDGDVERERTWTFEELAAMPLIERDITLTCVSNDVGGKYVGGARWLGVRLTDLLDEAGVGTTADQILSTDVDGFTISTPLDVARDGRDAMLAIGMNGEPLPREHGFPARLVTPGLYGFVGCTKWVTRLTLTTYEEQQAYWTERDWATDAPIKVASRIDTPKPLATLDAGKVMVGGIAWAQGRGIGKVEVRIDGGEWQQADLGPGVGVDYWRQWVLAWDAKPGRHDLEVRATADDGEVQTDERMTPFPEGSSGIQSIAVTVG